MYKKSFRVCAQKIPISTKNNHCLYRKMSTSEIFLIMLSRRCQAVFSFGLTFLSRINCMGVNTSSITRIYGLHIVHLVVRLIHCTRCSLLNYVSCALCIYVHRLFMVTAYKSGRRKEIRISEDTLNDILEKKISETVLTFMNYWRIVFCCSVLPHFTAYR